MRFFHLSDLHIGLKLYNKDLYEELMELENGKYRDPSQLEVEFFDLKSLNSSHVS